MVKVITYLFRHEKKEGKSLSVAGKLDSQIRIGNHMYREIFEEIKAGRRVIVTIQASKVPKRNPQFRTVQERRLIQETIKGWSSDLRPQYRKNLIFRSRGKGFGLVLSSELPSFDVEKFKQGVKELGSEEAVFKEWLVKGRGFGLGSVRKTGNAGLRWLSQAPDVFIRRFGAGHENTTVFRIGIGHAPAVDAALRQAIGSVNPIKIGEGIKVVHETDKPTVLEFRGQEFRLPTRKR